MSITVILWGAVLMCHAAASDFAGLAAARTFLGVFEASINPGTMLLFSMWYRRIEQPLRVGIWVGSAGLGYVSQFCHTSMPTSYGLCLGHCRHRFVWHWPHRWKLVQLEIHLSHMGRYHIPLGLCDLIRPPR